MNNNMIAEDRHWISFVGSDPHIFDQFINIVGQANNVEYKNGAFLVSNSTYKTISNVISKDNLKTIEENIPINDMDIEIGSELKLPPYPYQKDIIRYCLKQQKAIIVSPCGTGKTVLGIDIFLDSKKYGIISANAKGIIVVKTSLKIQWLREIEKFSNLNATIIDTYNKTTSSYQNKIKRLKKKIEPLLSDAIENCSEICSLRTKLEELELQAENDFNSIFSDKYDLFIVNYETLRDSKVRNALHKIKNLEYIIADEVHMIKSDTSKRTKALWEFADVKLRFGATATPVQKNPLDVYSICKFISPNTWKSKSAFAGRYITYSGYGRVNGSRNEKELNKKLSEFMIVKTKEEVSKQLPSLIPVVRYCELEPKQVEMTETLLDEIRGFKEQEKQLLSKSNQSEISEELLKIQANIMARQTFASELSTTEELLTVSESDLAKRYITGSKSNKIELLLDLLDEIISSGEKVAIFSKYQRLQDILKREISNRFPDVLVASAHGALNSEERYNEVYTKFQDNDKYKVLLLTDAFAEGVNLRKAKYLIEMEPADSYLIQTQRRGRIERADSIHDTVFVYQLIAEKSYDEISLKIVDKKEKYDAQIIKGKI